MIDEALKFLTLEVNKYLNMRSMPVSGTTDEIQLSSVTHAATEGSEVTIANGKLALSLINIEEERVVKEQRTAYRNENNDIEHYNPEIRINLYVLISARFDNISGASSYEEGLKQLSYVMTFFQGKHVFVPENSPDMPSELQKLIVELYSTSFEQQYNYWTVIGTKYLPSALYRVRLVTFQDKRILDQAAPITTSSINLTGN
ncbi:MAG: hypothetical protein FD123_2547 [Bacteroidetes bacterium]|nr:MAG: hypothetical protein FD123_2547 [Bacteroidota bacterium]